MVNISMIEDSQEKIKKLFVKQINNGAQSKVIQKVDEAAFTLGQFIEDHHRPQRGLHGASSGLRVLASYNDQNKLVVGLVIYLRDRVRLESNVQDEKEKISIEKIEKESKNVIKLSETLYALKFVQTAVMQTEDFKTSLAKELIDGMITDGSNQGWDFHVDDTKKKIQLLPSAFAILALGSNGNNVSIARSELIKKISKDEIDSPSRLAEYIFALYAIIYSSSTSDFNKESKIFDKILKIIWDSPYRYLGDDTEQNIEYWQGAENHYVRIPWQIYLICICSKLSIMKFYTVGIQKRLTSVVNSCMVGGGFKYQYSGFSISTRTNAIIFDVLEETKKRMDRNWIDYTIYYIIYYIDKIRLFFGSKLFRFIVRCFSYLFIGYVIYSFIIEKQEISNIAPEFVGAIIMGLLTMGKRK